MRYLYLFVYFLPYTCISIFYTISDTFLINLVPIKIKSYLLLTDTMRSSGVVVQPHRSVKYETFLEPNFYT